MSQITFVAKFLSYDEWKLRNPDVMGLEEECDVCDGTGEGECFHCGHATECEECGGSGVIKSAESIYENQLSHDKDVLRKYENWLARDAEHRVGAERAGAEDAASEVRTED